MCWVAYVRSVINTKILLCCVCVCVCACVCVCVCMYVGVLLSSSLPPHRSGYSSATFIFLSFVYSFLISFLHVEVMQSVLWLLCYCAVF